MLLIAVGLLCLLMLTNCDPAYAEEEEETRPRYYVETITWYKPNVEPKKQRYSFTWQSQCESFRLKILDMFAIHSEDPNFGFVMGECHKETEE
jgi:hypothetical protein